MPRASLASFHEIVWEHYRKQGRHDLPWRRTQDPYRILVSEVMLQQTQVERVIPYYDVFIKKFPTPQKLADAPLSEVLKAWQGLGYNRRAKMLHAAAKDVAAKYAGKFPSTVETLESLPGVGPYTARAVAAFAYDQDAVFIETNIRTAVMHHFFPGKKKVSDREIEAVLARALPAGRAREWNSALMDYGASLKRSGVRTNDRVKGYTKQSKFEGSLRQARGAVLRALIRGPLPSKTLVSLLGPERDQQMRGALASLLKDGLVELKKGKFSLGGR